MSRKRRKHDDGHAAGRYVPVVATSVVFGLAAGAVGMLMTIAYGDLSSLVPVTTTVQPQMNSEPRVIVNLPPVPDRDLSRSIVRFFASPSSLLNVRPPESVVASGVVLTSDGWIISQGRIDRPPADYVVHAAGEDRKVERVVTDLFTGAVFIKLDAQNLPVTPFSRNAAIQPGAVLFGVDVADGVLRHEVLAVGTPPEASDAGYSSERMQTFVRVTDAPGVVVGSPLTDVGGEVVAIVAARGEYGLLAVPVDRILSQVSSVLRDGDVNRPSLGVRYFDLSRFHVDAPYDEGALVDGRPDSGSPALDAGLRDGDVIVSVNGERVTGRNPLAELVAQYDPGDVVTVQYVRGGAEHAVEIALGRSE